MKKILSLILVVMAVTLPVIAQESSTRRVGLEVRQTKETTTRVHRMPMHIEIAAYYNVEEGTLEVFYDGEAIGETFLYLNGNLIGYDSEINTTFPIPGNGNYEIEIITSDWIALGSLQI
ncbi:MAG: hypothetical protein K2H96_07110 [Muribaculaceae bacterium]|nr:hypothetical protein [Muribaculaceae bacterium]